MREDIERKEMPLPLKVDGRLLKARADFWRKKKRRVVGLLEEGGRGFGKVRYTHRLPREAGVNSPKGRGGGFLNRR